MQILDMPQGSPEWFATRAGNIGASSFDKILTTKGVPSKSAKKLMYTLAIESITGVKESSYQSAAMERGMELEAEARRYYEMIYDVDIQQVGLCYPDDHQNYHCSPDGLMPELERGIEIKCPVASTHADYLIRGKLPTDYIQQVQGSMLVTGYKEWVFMSYYPGGVKPLILTIERDEEYIEKLRRELDKFVGNLKKTIAEITQ